MPRRIIFLIVIGILAGYAWWRYEHRGPGRAAERFTLSGVPRLRPEDVKATFTRELQRRARPGLRPLR